MSASATTPAHSPKRSTPHHGLGAGDPAAIADAWQVGIHLWPVLRALGYQSGFLGGRGANSDALAGRPPHLRRAGTPAAYLSFVAAIPGASGHNNIRLNRQAADLPRLPEYRGQLGVVLQDVPFKQSPYTPSQQKTLADYGTRFLTEGIMLSTGGGISVSLVNPQVLDGHDPSGRKTLARQADLVGAIRVPPRPSLDGPGIPVDVVLLRRRRLGTRTTGHAFTELSTIWLGEHLATINEYFATHPDNVLSSVLPGPDSALRLVPVADRARLGQQMQDAFKRISGAATERGLTSPGFLRPPSPQDQRADPAMSRVTEQEGRRDPQAGLSQ